MSAVEPDGEGRLRTGAEHAARARELLTSAYSSWQYDAYEDANLWTRMAQVHATLALALAQLGSTPIPPPATPP